MSTTRRRCGSSQCLDSLTYSFRSFPTFSLDLPTTTLWKTDSLTKDTHTTSYGCDEAGLDVYGNEFPPVDGAEIVDADENTTDS